jgi:hypothetical protein
MSKGNPFIAFRVPRSLRARIQEIIDSNNRHVRKEAWTMTTWILDAIMDKICHQDRARLQRMKRQARGKRVITDPLPTVEGMP